MAKKKTEIKITACTLCGKSIEYKTKKPTRCSQCRNINTTPKTPKTKWKKETQMIRAMSELLPNEEYIVNGYYSWLLSPKGMPLQLDWYCPAVGLAVEFNGGQHYEYVKYFHKTRKQFTYLQECDSIKSELCRARGITLMPVPYNVTPSSKLMGELLKKTNPSLYEKLSQAGRINGGPDEERERKDK